MILKPDEGRVRLPDRVDDFTARLTIWVGPGSLFFSPPLLALPTLEAAQAEWAKMGITRGRPVAFAVEHAPDGDYLRLLPAPDQPYSAELLYSLATRSL